MLAVLKAIWRGWKRAVHGINAVISFTLMTLVYVTAMPPVALWFRLGGRHRYERGLGGPDATTAWRPVTTPRQDVRRAQRPW